MARNGRAVQAEAYREVFLLLWRLQEGLSEGPAAVKVSEPQKSHFKSQQKAGWFLIPVNFLESWEKPFVLLCVYSSTIFGEKLPN